jgi:RHS repeat-associated protein
LSSPLLLPYLPFGETRATVNIPTDKLFTGQRLDGTGLYYYNARYYDPTIGKFISPDTVGLDLTNPQTLNRYTYCSNNPLRYTDPTGHWNWGTFWKVTAAVVAVAVVVTAVVLAPVVVPMIATAVASVTAAADTAIVTASVYATSALTTVATAAGIIAPAAEENGGSVFWCGQGMEQYAAQFAQKSGGTTLGMTQTGTAFSEISQGMDYWTESRPIWEELSKAFAESAKGVVNVFLNEGVPNPSSIWTTIEYPSLVNNPKVTQILYNIVMADGTIVTLTK